MTRVAAVLAAFALIAGAVLIRHTLDGEDGDRGATDGHGTTMRVVCAEEMRAACGSLGFGPRFEITVEDAAVTADKLAGSAGGTVLDIWAVSQPWPAMVDEARGRAGLAPLFGDESTVVGSSEMVVVGGDIQGCDWKCLGAGDRTLGTRPPGSGLGLLFVGAATAGYFGRADFATNDFDPAFDRWLAGLVEAIHPTGTPVTQLLQSRAFFDVALSYRAEAAPTLEAASDDRTVGLSLQRPSPAASLVGVIVTGPNGLPSEADDLASSLRLALADRGWIDKAPATSGLPSPGVLTALRDRVSR